MKYALALLLAGLAGCPPKPPTPPTPPERDAGAATCSDACTHLAALGCKEGKPTPEGSTCAEVCENVQSSGVISWNLGCRTHIESCAQVDDCED